ncbi:MAG: efflux RND transporter permease subunit [Pseudomonadota bacterium]
MKDIYDGGDLPDIWTKMRDRVADVRLPEGAGPPIINDTFGDVFGIYYAVLTPGYTDKEIYDLSTFLRRELLTVEGVADVDITGLRNEVVYVEPDPVVSRNLNVPPGAIMEAISTADSVTEGGQVNAADGGRLLIQRPEGSDTVSAIAGLTVGVGGEVINLHDFTNVYRERERDPSLMIRHNGQEAFTLGIAGIETENIVDVGHRTDQKLADMAHLLPAGVDIQPIYQQHLVVEESSNGFLVNLAMSVSIVFVVLALFMGLRAAIVVGLTLLLTVVGTLLFMAIFSIAMERISLGALIIAMGMLVDNAIVVAEGMQNSMQRGKNSREAAKEAAAKTQVPLLGATVIAIMAFAGIGLSPDSTGEFMFSLFAVIGISLMLSWLLALTATPLLGHYCFKQGTGDTGSGYDGALFRAYGGFLRGCIKAWFLVIPGLIAITVVCVMMFGQIKQQFFPDSNTPLFFVNYKIAQGASIHDTSADMKLFEDWLADQPNAVAYTSYVGGGAIRFMLTYDAEDPNPSYGHIIVRTEDLEHIAPLMEEMKTFAAENLPWGEFRAKRLAFGPGGGDPIEIRFSGSDPVVLRELANEAIARLVAASDDVRTPKTDWREMEQVLRPIYSDDRAQEAGITRDDITTTLRYATDGIDAGVYREGDRQIPIVLRSPPEAELALTDHVVYSSSGNAFVPLEQMIDGMEFESQNTLVHRFDRVFTITVGAEIPIGFTAAQVQNQINETIEEMPLPDGYFMEWGGEKENSADSQESLAAQLPMSVLVMVLISVLLFNALRQPLIIWLLVPMSINGISIALLATDLPFTFTALLGLLSLSGMLIKNGIVLVEEIDIVRREQPNEPLVDSIVMASTSRLRPVVLAAATTILGMIPLLTDAFFQSMAVAIMGGLAFASILTLIAAPVLYYLFFMRAAPPEAAEEMEAAQAA